MKNGYVYVLSNKSMPGLLKIGRSINCVESRAKQIYQTGVPTPFTVEFECSTIDCFRLESEVHQELSEYRVNPGREFFNINIDNAIDKIEQANRRIEPVNVTEFLDDLPLGAGARKVLNRLREDFKQCDIDRAIVQTMADFDWR